MEKLVVQLVATGLAASVSPVALVALIDIMSYKNAIKNSLAFLLGFGSTLLLIGVTGLFLFKTGYGSAIVPAGLKGYIDIGLGLLCFGLLIYVFRKPSRKDAKKDTAGKSMKAGKAFFLGIIFMVTNSSTLVIYISGLHIIGSSKLEMTNEIISLAILTFITLITVLIPILLYAITPIKAEAALSSLGGWLNRHNKIIGVFILGGFGVYLTIRGLLGL